MSLRIVLGPPGPFWVLLDHFRHFCWFLTILGRFGPFRGPCGSLNGPMGGPILHMIMYYVPGNYSRATRTILCLVGPFLPLLVILGHFRPFWAILGLPRVPRWPQGGPTWHIIMYYTHRDCFRAIRSLPERYLAPDQFLPVGVWAPLSVKTVCPILQEDIYPIMISSIVLKSVLWRGP